MNRKIYLDKLFPKLPHLTNIKNLQIDDESVSYITTPIDTRSITNIIENHMKSLCKPFNISTIVDATAGVGGDTIMFANYARNVISIELNSARCEMLKHNITEYKFTNCTVINGDATVVIPTLNNIDVIYIDPPWGGKDYKNKEMLKLSLGSIEIEQFVIDCFNNVSGLHLIALKLPQNYDIKYFYDKLSPKYNIHLYKLRKFNILLVY